MVGPTGTPAADGVVVREAVTAVGRLVLGGQRATAAGLLPLPVRRAYLYTLKTVPVSQRHLGVAKIAYTGDTQRASHCRPDHPMDFCSGLRGLCTATGSVPRARPPAPLREHSPRQLSETTLRSQRQAGVALKALSHLLTVPTNVHQSDDI